MKTIELKMNSKEITLVILSNSIAKTRYSLSLPTQKLLLLLISKITFEERKQKVFLNTLEFPLEEMYSFLRFSGRENSRDLKALLKNCVSEIGRNNIKFSQIDSKGKEYWVEYPWSSKSEIREDKGIFSYEFNDKIAEILLPLQNYFKSDVKEYLQLSSSHAISLYMLFRANEFTTKIQSYYIEEIKENLGIDSKYKEWAELKRVVLDPSFTQLNKETNYFFTYETKRIGRSIGKIEIRVIDKKNKEEFSDYFSDKIQEFLKKEKVESSVRRNFQLVKYEYDAKENCIYISFKNEKILKDFISSNPMFGVSNTSSSDILNELLDRYIAKNKEFKRYLKSMFRKDLKIYYK